MADSQAQNPQFPDPLLQRFFLSPQEKADKEKGKAIVKALYSRQTSNDSNLNFFKARSARWQMLRLWAKGSQNMQEFLDYMNISDGNKAWVNIDTTPSRLAVQFLGTIVESMAKNKTYACVNAIDDGSVTEKENRMYEALFRMHEIETIKQAQQQSGVQLEPTGAYVPDDEIAAKVHFELEDKLPKEIRFEKLIASLQNDISFDTVANRKTLTTLSVLNCAVTKIEKLPDGNYTARVCVPDNMVYNFFMNDTGDCEITEIGEFYNLKVKDFRSRFGKSPDRPDGLEEKEIYELAKLSSNKNIGTNGAALFNYAWNNNYALNNYNMNRPYDDCSILVLDCEINFAEDNYYVSKKDNFGRETLQAKKSIPYQQTNKKGEIIQQQKPDDVQVIKSKRNTWMRGVYAPYGDKLLYWGAPDIIISPFTDYYKPLCSYSINIPGNDGEYIPSLFERIIEPLREYQLTKLKRKQLIAKLRPSGFKIDVESARNIDLGNGDSVAWEEVIRIYDQTGNELWSSKGIDPMQPAAPAISPGVQDETIQKIIGLTNVLQGIMQEIRTLIGSSVYLEGGDLGDRTATSLAENQVAQASNVFGYIVNGNNKLWEDTFYKICLLHWNDIVKQEPESKDDMINTRFNLSVKIKATEYQKQLLEQDIQRYSQVVDATGNPAISPKDAMILREIDDFKLARWYLAATVESNRRKSIQESQILQSQNAQVQQQSAQQAAEQQAQLKQMEIQQEKDMIVFQTQENMKLALLNGYMSAMQHGVVNPNVIMPLIQQLIPNIEIPLQQENQQMQQAIAAQQQQQMQQAMVEQQQGGQQQLPQGAQEEQQEPQQEPPQQEAQEQ